MRQPRQNSLHQTRSAALRLSFTLVAAFAVALMLRPDLRLALQTVRFDPRLMRALEAEPRIRYEEAARGCADDVAKLLPAAVTRIEAVHGALFAKPPLVAVYAAYDNYARANGLDTSATAGVTRALPGGRAAALLSPTLCGGERARLYSVMTHELSHVHFALARKSGAARPPQWFTEGLAVMASNGGGAEGVSDEEAAQAIRDGVAIILDDRPWHDFAALGFAREPTTPQGRDAVTYRQRLAFRQAGLFIGWLRAKNEARFQRLLRALEDGSPFEAAFETTFAAASANLWAEFSGR